MKPENQRDTIRDLTAFVVVARELSFTRAAGKLGVSQSALSYTIKALEERLGIRLLTRTTRAVRLTEAGERLLGTAGVHLDGIEQALATLSTFRDRPSGTVRIASSDHAAATVLHPVLARLLPRYPEVTVELVVENGMTDIVAKRCDAGVRLGEHLAHEMIAARISPDQRMAVVATPAYFAKHGRPATPHDLKPHSLLAYRQETNGNLYSWELEKDGKKIEIRPEGQLVSNDPDQIARFCLSGLGIACMQESYFEEAIAQHRLERVLDDWCPPFAGYFLYYPSRRQPTAAFTLVLEALRRRAG
jgi:DNA-binding transcriptional LysR family regulator